MMDATADSRPVQAAFGVPAGPASPGLDKAWLVRASVQAPSRLVSPKAARRTNHSRRYAGAGVTTCTE
jgi:hypothetical protein